MTIDTQSQGLHGSPLLVCVEDDTQLLAVYRVLFSSLGFRCIPCPTADKAMKAVLSRPVDILVTDFDMPMMSGAVLAKCLRKVRPRLPMLLITGRTHIPDHSAKLFDRIIHKGSRKEQIPQAVLDVYRSRLTNRPDRMQLNY